MTSNLEQGVNTFVGAAGSLDILSQKEVNTLCDVSQSGLYGIFRQCVLAVLSSSPYTHDAQSLLERYKDFEIIVIQRDHGIELELKNAPPNAFVDNKMIMGIREHLFSVVRDIVYNYGEIQTSNVFDLSSSNGITHAVFHMLRNAKALKSEHFPSIAVCWGGHAIKRQEYDYTKEVGYQLGLRSINVCTGCGPGAMKGPMKGAAVGHVKQRKSDGRYIGLSEPGIIAAESPNPIVNELIIMPDIEKRLEAFVRLGHAFIVFPGGVGTVEEILYLLGILSNPENKSMPFPFILTGPKSSEKYFEQIDNFVRATLGLAAAQRYQVIIDDPNTVAKKVLQGMEEVKQYRKSNSDAYYFNWNLSIDPEFQKPFKVSHDSMSKLILKLDQPKHDLAVNLRRVFSGIVTGNVKMDGIKQIKKHGPFQIHGDKEVMQLIDAMLKAFIQQGRMQLVKGSDYNPCYELVTNS